MAAAALRFVSTRRERRWARRFFKCRLTSRKIDWQAFSRRVLRRLEPLTMSDLCLFDESDPMVAVVTLNRPQKRNALNIELMEELTRVVHRAAAVRKRRVLILRGAGPVFCAGLDLEEASA